MLCSQNDEETIKSLENIFPDITAGDKRKMGENKNILEKSERVNRFIEQHWTFKEPDMRIRDEFDKPFLKYIRERKNRQRA